MSAKPPSAPSAASAQTAPSIPGARFRIADLSQNKPTRFTLVPAAAELETLAQEMGVDALRKLRFEGEIRSRGKRDWQLSARLGFTVVQPCVVTLEPVTSRIETEVNRLYLAHFDLPEGHEVEMPEDDTTEALGEEIAPIEVMAEALALHIPQYPRKDDAELGSFNHAEDGVTPMRDEDTRPFAALAGLMSQGGASQDSAQKDEDEGAPTDNTPKDA